MSMKEAEDNNLCQALCVWNVSDELLCYLLSEKQLKCVIGSHRTVKT